MKRLFCTIALLCTISNYAALPIAKSDNNPRNFFSVEVENTTHEIIGVIRINGKLFVEINSPDGIHKLVGVDNRVYDMPDLTNLQGIDLTTQKGTDLRNKALYAAQLKIAVHDPNIFFISLFFHSFGVYGAYKLVKKAQKKIALSQRYTHLVSLLKRVKNKYTAA